MGNRAVITTAPYSPANVGIYVHWNGGRASVQGFLDACRELKMRSPEGDTHYAMASLTHIIGLHFGSSGLSLGVGRCDQLDTSNGDNGTYLIGGNWEIVGRRFNDGHTASARGKLKLHEDDLWSGEEINPEKTKAICKWIVEKARAAQAIEARES